MNPKECEQRLMEFVQKLNPILNPIGFVFEISGSGVASGGPFAAGYYANGEKKVGLIYRAIAGLGAVIYEYRQTGISHSDLMHYLGKVEISKLGYDKNKFSSFSKDDESIFDALVYDIQNFGMGFLTSNDEQFSETVKTVSKNQNAFPDSKIMDGIIIGMIVGGITGFVFQNLGWGVFIGFVIGLIGGVLFDLRKDKKFSGE